jgi:hypothetical protein
MFVQKREAFHHPRVEAVARMTSDLAHDVRPVFEPLQLAARRHRKDRGFAVLAAIAVLGYVFAAIESETRLSVVW